MYHKAFGGRALPEPVGFRGFPGGGKDGKERKKGDDKNGEGSAVFKQITATVTIINLGLNTGWNL